MNVNIPEKIAQPMSFQCIDSQYTENLKGAVTLNSIEQGQLDKQVPNSQLYNRYNQQQYEQQYRQQVNTPPNQQGFGQPQHNTQAVHQQYRQGNQNQFSGQSFNQPQRQVNQQEAYMPRQVNIPAATQQIKNRPRVTGQIIQKGQRVHIQRQGQRVSAIEVCIGWDLGPRAQAQGYKLDVEAFMLDERDIVIGDDWFVFYNQPKSPDNSVQLRASEYAEAGTGDDSIISVQLDRVNQAVQRITFILTIDRAKQNGYNFSNISNAYVRIVDSATKMELLRFNLADYYENVNSMMLLEVYRNKGEWKANAIGDGVSADLYDLCRRYGVDVND